MQSCKFLDHVSLSESYLPGPCLHEPGLSRLCLSTVCLDPVCLDAVFLDATCLDPVCLSTVCLVCLGPCPRYLPCVGLGYTGTTEH